MIGKSWIREQGMQDALLCAAMRDRKLEDVPLWRHPFPERDAMMAHWNSLTPMRDGPVAHSKSEITDPRELSSLIKEKAGKLGAADTGMTALKPEFIELGVDLPHKNVIAVIVYEDYAKALEGPNEVDLEAMTAYAKCADISTDIARYIREELGYPAVAHHNGSFQIQAIPVCQEVGFGELGRHGSLIHPEIGANWRPGFITTDLPVVYDMPRNFGIQDYCTTCNLCRNNCPGDAIPDDNIVTDGVKRWLTDIDRCYSISRFREAYCHICIDVCPYIWKENGDGEKRNMFRDYMKIRKVEGYKTPKGPDTLSSFESAENVPKMTVSADAVANMRQSKSDPSETHPAIQELAAAALSVLARDGTQGNDGKRPGDLSWKYRGETPEGFEFHISFSGPELPDKIALKTLSPSSVPNDPKWQGTYHLTIAPPNIAFEMVWSSKDPVRIIYFSRGDWETQLLELAG